MNKSSSCNEGFEKSQLPKFNLTIIRDTNLAQRLAAEVRFTFQQVRTAWPAFKNDPLGFATQTFTEALRRTIRSLSRPHVLSASLTSLVLVSLAVLILFSYGGRSAKSIQSINDELSQTVRIDLPADIDRDSGVGAGEQGRVGFNTDKGEGSRPAFARSHGGGSGGQRAKSPEPQGRLPQPSDIPAPIPNLPSALPRALPLAGIDLDPALWKNLAFASYGDPRSKSTTPSNGPGDGGGMGTGNGTGIGEGDGGGFGPGRDGNMGGGPNKPGGGKKGGGVGGNPDDSGRVYSNPQVDTRVRLLSKPEPQYTEDARRNQTSGTVILRVVFSSSGEVTNIRPIHTLPDGLTEKAIAAARQIRFLPATIDGRPVSMYMQLEYNFNLY